MTPDIAMSEIPILDEIGAVIAESFPSIRPIMRTKGTGALATEVLRERIRKANIPVSARDVFIQGNPAEFDILIVRPGASPSYSIVYDPMDVTAALEIKYSGVFSREATAALKRRFEKVTTDHSHIKCAYLAIRENPSFKNRVTTATLGFQAFTLYWVNTKDEIVEPPGSDWQSVIEFLRNSMRQLPEPPG